MPMNTICTDLMVSGHGVTINTVCFARPMLCISLVASEASFLVCSIQWSRQRENFRNFSYNYVIAEVLVGALFGREDTLSLPVHGAGVEARNIALE